MIRITILMLISINLYSQDILVVISHDGDFKILERDYCKDNKCVNDSYTKEIGYELADRLKCNLIYNYFHRSTVDMNRSPKLAYDSKIGEIFYNEFHNRIKSYISNSDSLIILDIHGHIGSEIMLGFDGTEPLYKLGDELMSEGYYTIPNSNNTTRPKFGGGYITETYNTHPGVKVIQIELPKYIRFNKIKRNKFIEEFSKIISKYGT